MHTWSLMHSMHTVEMEIEIVDCNIVIVFNSTIMIAFTVLLYRIKDRIKDFRLINSLQTIKLLEVLLIMLIHKCI